MTDQKPEDDRDKKKEVEFGALVARFSGFIRGHILKFNPHKFGLDPDDISQEVRIKIWQLLRTEKNIASLASYIRKIVESSVIDSIRKVKRDERLILQEKMNQVSDIKNRYADESQEEEHLKNLIGAAVDSLLESRRMAVRLHLMNLSIEEISGITRWTKHKTRNLLYRGLSDLKAILKNKDIRYENK